MEKKIFLLFLCYFCFSIVSSYSTIELQDANTENLADAGVIVTTPNTNYDTQGWIGSLNSYGRRTYFMFNITNLSDAYIHNATFYYDWQTSRTAYYYLMLVENNTWNESTITWNNQPCSNASAIPGGSYCASNISNQTVNGSSSVLFNDTNLTGMIQRAIDLGLGKISFVTWGGTATSEEIYTKEGAGGDPTLTINYTLEPNVTILFPTNNYATTSNESIELNFSFVNYTNIDTCWYYVLNSTEGYDVDNSSIDCYSNYTFNLSSNGNYSVYLKVNDTNGRIDLDYKEIIFDNVTPIIDGISISTTAGSKTVEVGFNVSDLNTEICWYSIFNSSGGIEVSNTTMVCNSSNNSQTLSEFGSYNFTTWANDSAGNIGFNYSTFNISVASSSGGGGGGGTVNRVTVIAIEKPSNLTTLYLDLDRAKLYARTREKCNNVSEIDNCELNFDERMAVLESLDEQEFSITMEEYDLFFVNYLDQLFQEVKVLDTDAEEYNLYKATLQILDQPFTTSPKSVDAYFLITSPNSEFKYVVRTNKIVSDVSITGELGFSVEKLTDTTIEITFKPQTLDFSAQNFKATANYISVDGESSFQEIQVRAVYLLNPLIIFIGFGVVGMFVFIYIANQKKLFKKLKL